MLRSEDLKRLLAEAGERGSRLEPRFGLTCTVNCCSGLLDFKFSCFRLSMFPSMKAVMSSTSTQNDLTCGIPLLVQHQTGSVTPHVCTCKGLRLQGHQVRALYGCRIVMAGCLLQVGSPATARAAGAEQHHGGLQDLSSRVLVGARRLLSSLPRLLRDARSFTASFNVRHRRWDENECAAPSS